MTISPEEIQLMISKFEALEVALKELCDDYDAKRAAAIPAEVQVVLDDLAVEYGPKIANAQGGLEILESNIKALVVASEHTFSGNRVKFTYNKGKSSWDSDMLKGMMALIPALEKAHKTGNPYTSVSGKGK